MGIEMRATSTAAPRSTPKNTLFDQIPAALAPMDAFQPTQRMIGVVINQYMFKIPLAVLGAGTASNSYQALNLLQEVGGATLDAGKPATRVVSSSR